MTDTEGFPSFDVRPDVERQTPSTASSHYTDFNWIRERTQPYYFVAKSLGHNFVFRFADSPAPKLIGFQ